VLRRGAVRCAGGGRSLLGLLWGRGVSCLVRGMYALCQTGPESPPLPWTLNYGGGGGRVRVGEVGTHTDPQA